MKAISRALVALIFTATAFAVGPKANFAGQWSFDPSQSQNVGMMASATVKTHISQSKNDVIVEDTSTLNGQTQTQHTVYSLAGKPTENVSLMAGQATTRSHWEGVQLVTEWESAGAIAGTVTKRTETRYLSADGKTMFVKSVRPGKEPVIMVFVRSK